MIILDRHSDQICVDAHIEAGEMIKEARHLVKSCVEKEKYTIIGYKGKQVRDNLHSRDLIKCFWNFFKKPRVGEVYNIGGGRKSNCSIIEAISIVQNIIQKKIKIKYKKKNRVGDHIFHIKSLNSHLVPKNDDSR